MNLGGGEMEGGRRKSDEAARPAIIPLIFIVDEALVVREMRKFLLEE